jgi:hypothetical protein
MMYYCRFSFAVIAALVLLIHSGCQKQAKAPETKLTSPAAGGNPKITFENTVYDFGEIAAGRKYTGQFKFINTGNGVLKIIDVKKCCGAVVTLDKKELSPGESGMIKVECNSGRRAGQVAKQLHVSSNDETKPIVALTIKAKVVIRVDYQPQRIDLLLNKENAGCPNITIRSLDNQPFSITSFQSAGETITADVDPSVKATEFVLEPKVDLDKLQKHPGGLVTVNLTHPELNKVYIRFITKQRFQLIPSGVFLLNPLRDKPSINKVSIVSNYGEDFEIKSTSSEKGMAKVVNQQGIKGGYRLDIEITPPAPEGETRSFDDVVDVNLKGGQTLKIKCYVRYLSKGQD